MWMAIIAFCAVYPVQSVKLTESIGPGHIQIKQEFSVPLHYAAIYRNYSQDYNIYETQHLRGYLKNFLTKLDSTVIERSVHYITLRELMALFTLYLYDIHLNGFQCAKVELLEVRMKDAKVDFDIFVPYISVKFTMFMNGMIDANTFSLLGNLSAHLYNLRVNGSLQAREKSESGKLVYQIAGVDIDIYYFSALIDLKIVEEMEVFKFILERFLNHPKDTIIRSIAQAILHMVNVELGKYPAANINLALSA